MCYKKLIIVAAIIATICATAARAEIPIIQADTVFLGFGGGSVSGIVFGPTGETVILMHGAQPVEININTHQIVREFEKVPNYTEGGGHFFYLKEKGLLIDNARSTEFNGIKNFVGNVFWDINTGKIVMAKRGQIILSDGIKCFSFYTNNDRKYLGKYDINTFKYIDSIYLPKDMPGIGSAEWGAIGIIPNSNKVLVGVKRYIENTLYLAELYVLDFDTKQYAKIPISYETGQNSSEITNITISKTGLNNIITIKVIGKGYYFYIYDKNFNFMEKVLYDSIKYNNYPVGFGTGITFIDDRFIVSDFYNGATKVMVFDTRNKEIKLICPFYTHAGVDIYNNTIVMADNLGITAIIDVEPISVNEPKEVETNSVIYQDSNLVINSTFNEKVDIEVVDYNGNILYSRKLLNLTKGKNFIPIDLPLSNGIYFLLIKAKSGNFSYKFLVSR